MAVNGWQFGSILCYSVISYSCIRACDIRPVDVCRQAGRTALDLARTAEIRRFLTVSVLFLLLSFLRNIMIVMLWMVLKFYGLFECCKCYQFIYCFIFIILFVYIFAEKFSGIK